MSAYVVLLLVAAAASRYLGEFKWLLLTFLLALAFFLAARIYDLLLTEDNVGHYALWEARGYTAVWVMHRITLVLFYMVAAASALQVVSARFFSIEALVTAVQGPAAGAGSTRQ